MDLRAWYEGEDNGGRGRWIEATELDYSDFRPGVNAPVPGAYMGWTGCVTNVDTGYVGYYAFGVSHSLMIDEMTVHRDAYGNVFKVEATFIEGNSRNRVRNNRSPWDDLIVFTPQGSQWIGWNDGPDEVAGTIDDIGLKIYGFGIDLDASGNPIYDETRLHYKDHPSIRLVSVNLVIPEDETWDKTYAPRVPAMRTLVSKLRANKGPDITCTTDKISCSRLPDGNTRTWNFPSGLQEEVSIQVDFLAPNPLPLKGVQMLWSPGYLPQGVQVTLGDTLKQVYTTKVTDFSKYTPPKDAGPIPMMAELSQPVSGIRYVIFTFPKGTFGSDSAILEDFLMPYDEGDYKDADENPDDLPVFVDIKPGSCPNIVLPKGSGTILVALLGSDTVSAEAIDAQTIRLNGKSLLQQSLIYQDVAEPFIGSAPGCNTYGPDGYTDLVLGYDLDEFRKNLGLDSLESGKHLAVKVTGQMIKKAGGSPFLGQDFVKTTCSGETVVLTDTVFESGTESECSATTAFTLGKNVIVKDGAKLSVTAPEVTVDNGCQAEEGSEVLINQGSAPK